MSGRPFGTVIKSDDSFSPYIKIRASGPSGKMPLPVAEFETERKIETECTVKST